MDVKNTSKEKLLFAAGVFLTVALALFVYGKINDVEQPQYGKINAVNAPKPSGDSGVKVTVFSDFQCPYCSRAVPVIKGIREEYGRRVEVEFRHFPLKFHENAVKSAQASECAREQGRFWDYHDLLFENQNNLEDSALKDYAKKLGLDVNRFNLCLDDGLKAGKVSSDYELGRSLGVTGTPTFFVGEEKIVGAQPVEVFVEVIDSQLNGSEEVVDEGIQEVSAKSQDPLGSCNGACGRPSCAAASGGSCGCS
ncbi:MAG: thioredoxin domain-containing protein [Candidatus Altiarchaeales archaeon]|nr:thioredoxin domain-containing protein [Candidatus Altiarchaeales archaeon]